MFLIIWNYIMTNSIAAVFGVLGFAVGTVFGGLIIKHYKLKGRAHTVILLTFEIFNVLLFVLKCFLSCDSVVNDIAESGR